MPISKIKTGSIQNSTIQSNDIDCGAVQGTNLTPSSVPGTSIAPGAITTTQISPSAAIAVSKLANSGITLNGTSVTLGGSVTIPAGINWQSKVVADGSTVINASNGEGYFVDTTSGVIEIFLPSSPSLGDTVLVVDYGGAASTNKIIINTGGELIDSTEGGPSAGSDFSIETNNLVSEFVYTDSNRGWILRTQSTLGSTPASVTGEGQGQYLSDASYINATGGTISYDGDFKIHTFTGDGCFAVCSTGGPAATGLDQVSYLVLAGGGGGGRNHGGGGGGGGFREGKVSSPAVAADCYSVSPLDSGGGLTVTAGTYPISVGGAGSAGSPSAAPSGSGSTFSTISSAGGGGGGGRNGRNAGTSGGSGAGGSHGGGGGSGNSPPVSPPQGTSGSGASGLTGGSGGGAITSGAVTTASRDGATTSISGAPIKYGSGGGGGRTGSRGDKGSPDVANRGAGGYGGHDGFGHGSSGSKGVVIIRYKYQ